ncbi:MAG: hypothetical protein JWQ02_1208 [Capsulimonas sp.]|nr:hypothetical protein [Capsulimonas sp.]
MKLKTILPFVCLCPLLAVAGVVIHNYSSSHIQVAESPTKTIQSIQPYKYSKQSSRNFKSNQYAVSPSETRDYYMLLKRARRLGDTREARELETAHRRHIVAMSSDHVAAAPASSIPASSGLNQSIEALNGGQIAVYTPQVPLRLMMIP